MKEYEIYCRIHITRLCESLCNRYETGTVVSETFDKLVELVKSEGIIDGSRSFAMNLIRETAVKVIGGKYDIQRIIIDESGKDIGSKYIDSKGDKFLFYGVVHADDDYYYGMMDLVTKETILLTCVGSLETHGFEKLV